MECFSTAPASGVFPRLQKRHVFHEEGLVFPETTRLPTVFVGSVSERYTRKIWKKDRDFIRTYFRRCCMKIFFGTFSDSDSAIRTIDKYLRKFTKLGHKHIRIVYTGEVNSLGRDDNRLVFQTGRDLSVRGFVNFVLGKGMSLDLLIVSHRSFTWANVEGIKLQPESSFTVYYPEYLLPTSLKDSNLDMFDKTGSKTLKEWQFFKVVYKSS